MLERMKIPDEAAAHLKKGQGGVIEYEGKKAGAYRDEKGSVHVVSLTCPHLGCILKWNPEELSWDCPCHGSRFTYKGDIIKGPATCSLSSIHEDKNKCDPHVIR